MFTISVYAYGLDVSYLTATQVLIQCQCSVDLGHLFLFLHFFWPLAFSVSYDLSLSLITVAFSTTFVSYPVALYPQMNHIIWYLSLWLILFDMVTLNFIQLVNLDKSCTISSLWHLHSIPLSVSAIASLSIHLLLIIWIVSTS